MKEKTEWYDIAKFIAIWSVILGNSGNDSIHEFVAVYHTPLFLFTGGYFLSQIALPDFIKEKAKALLSPYLQTCLVMILVGVGECLLSGHSASAGEAALYWLKASAYGAGFNHPFMEAIGVSKIGAIWYFLGFLQAMILVRLICKINSKPVQFAIVLAMFALGVYSTDFFWLPLSVQAALTATLFVYAGWQFREYDLLKTRNIGYIWIPALLLLGFCWYKDWNVLVYKNHYSLWLLSALIAIIVDLGFIVISMKLEDILPVSILKIVTLYGRNTAVILCLHLIESTFIPWDQIITIGGPLISFIIIHIIKAIIFYLAVYLYEEKKKAA
ncbi:MAG: hypothetical protein IJM15_00745 [Erysipelotrichaceae bacterium]|nr:hypothetical protein [Erysipelotrichaceae bacterium]